MEGVPRQYRGRCSSRCFRDHGYGQPDSGDARQGRNLNTAGTIDYQGGRYAYFDSNDRLAVTLELLENF